MTDSEERAEQEFNDRYGSSYATIDKMSKEECWEEGFCVEAELLSDELNTCQELLGKEKVKNVEQSLELTEAKEIIKELIDNLGKFYDDYPDFVIKAEAFLKE